MVIRFFKGGIVFLFAVCVISAFSFVLTLFILSAVFMLGLAACRSVFRRWRTAVSDSRPRLNAFAPVAALGMLSFLCGCQEQAARKPPLDTVRYTQVETRRITLTRALPGRVSAFKVSEVRPQVTGIIQARLFEEGSDVPAGQVLYQIDPALYQVAYNNAKANLGQVLAEEEAAGLMAKRYTHLSKTNAVSKQDRDDAAAAYNRIKAKIEACRETLESAAINLGYTGITAPVGGRIGRSSVTEGALVTQHQEAPLAKIQQISPVYVDVTQSNTQLLRLRRALASGSMIKGGPDSAKMRLYLEDGSPYRRRTSSGSGEWIEGILLFSDITIDESTGTVALRAKFDNPESVLLPGMYVHAEVVEGILEGAVLVPQKSVVRDNRNMPQVFVLKPSAGENAAGAEVYTVEARPVIIDRDHGTSWLLGSGLASGELLVIDGVQKARPGQKVLGTPTETTSQSSSTTPGDTAVLSVSTERR
jgi:membrane fusion protein (multidrug efflux system)